MRNEINGMQPDALRAWMQKLNEPAFRGSQLFTHFHKHKKTLNDPVKGFPKGLQEKIAQAADVGEAVIAESIASADGSAVKHALTLTDGQVVEAVTMQYPNHSTLCISTQVGCAMGCAFCASTKQGLFRNITAAEMAAQFYAAENEKGSPIQNLVLMGIGEPLQNYDETVRALRILHHPDGRGLSCRNITLSTCGIVPQMLRLAKEELPINLVISLHAATDEKRRKIMPIAKEYSIADVIRAADTYFEQTGRRISYEYTIIPGVNDTPEDVEQLSALLRGKQAHINLIAYHPIKEYRQDKPDRKAMHTFAARLMRKGIRTTVRKSIGLSEEGACGQLRARGERRQEVMNGNSTTNR